MRLASLVAIVGAGVATTACTRPQPPGGAALSDRGRRVLVLGVDGMDPALLRELIDAGRMPALARVAARGALVPLRTSAPPQSPVAWSNVIAGAGPGMHQIFDFIHRDLDPGGGVVPYLSTSRVVPAGRDWAIPAGRWRIPFFGSSTELLRRGGAFWDELVAHGVETAVYRMPASYPPPDVSGPGRFTCLCGMGTPDLLGSYGEFTFFTPDAPPQGRPVPGGRFVNLMVRNHRARATLEGPPNYLMRPDAHGQVPPLATPIEIVRDAEADVARIVVGDEVVLLNAGEWSDWVPLRLETGFPGSALLGALGLPTSLPAMVRFHLEQVHPELELYVTPLNIDPLDPVNPISAPRDFAARLAEACGRFYTTGIPEDTAALRAGALDEDRFLRQVRDLLAERAAQYRQALRHFDEGFLFFYFGHVDQLSHVFWRDRDPDHPGRRPGESQRYGTVIEDAYVQMDGLVGEALGILEGDDTLIVMSDHGFGSFRRAFNLNSWLVERGFMTLPEQARGASAYLEGVDWPRTRAYALGLNALYVNLAGREAQGAVRPGAEREALLEEIAAGLLELRDADGSAIVETVYRVDEVYPGADPALAPDLLVGYADGYRASWATAEGRAPPDLVEDNLDRWSGDHCVADRLVPGILVTNRALRVRDPALVDLAPTILAEFGIAAPPRMEGRDLFRR
jgi:predicted AlkP superfamily phosphohydrolase/phosphomutase